MCLPSAIMRDLTAGRPGRRSQRRAAGTVVRRRPAARRPRPERTRAGPPLRPDCGELLGLSR